MKHKSYESSYATKQVICASLKKLMAQKPLEKITISEIMDDCGMVRQHFYYHFEDIYDLVRWMFQEEAVSLLKRQEGALQYLQENRAVCLCALNSLSRPHLKRLFFSDIHAIIRRSVTQITDFLGCSDDTEPEMFTHFYVIALAGLVESWLLGEIDKTPGQLIQFTDTLIQNQIRGAAVQLQEQASDTP